VQRALFSTEDERVAIFNLGLVHVPVCLHLHTIPLAYSDQMVPWLGLDLKFRKSLKGCRLDGELKLAGIGAHITCMRYNHIEFEQV